jgi:hypothetical protein
MTAASNEVVAVIQADRIAYADLRGIGEGDLRTAILSGGFDKANAEALQILARHRLAHSDPRPVAGREDMARLIDPEAFEPTDNFDLRHNRDMRRAEAFSAADRVLATHSPAPMAGEGAVETRFWSIVDANGLAAVPSDMWDALEVISRKCGHYDKLVRALHDAICSPKGVVPDSADPYYRSSLCAAHPSTQEGGK